MVNSSKILTVSYGTFSCTLEGFDDSFDTMKAIAEYFRDLASDDRYFGAEPPTPDAEMLARIAEREIARRVEAHEDMGKIVLRASDAQALPVAPNPEIESPADEPVAEMDPIQDTPAVQEPVEALAEDATEADVVETPAVEGVAEVEEEPVAEVQATEPEIVEPVETEISPEVVVAVEPEAVMPADALMSEAEAFFASDTIDVAEDAIEDEAPTAEIDETDVDTLAVAAEEIETAVDATFEDEATAYYQAPVADAAVDYPDPDSVAAKLSRIRSVVSHNDETLEAYESDDFNEDEHAQDFLNEAAADLDAALAQDDQVELQSAEDETPQDFTADMVALDAISDAMASDDIAEAVDDTEVSAEDGEEADDMLQDTLTQLMADVIPDDSFSEDIPVAEAFDEAEVVDTTPAEMDEDVDFGDDDETHTPLNARVIKMKRRDFEAAVAGGLLEEDVAENVFVAQADDMVHDDAIGEDDPDLHLSVDEEEDLQRELAEVEAELMSEVATEEAVETILEAEPEVEVEDVVDEQAEAEEAEFEDTDLEEGELEEVEPEEVEPEQVLHEDEPQPAVREGKRQLSEGADAASDLERIFDEADTQRDAPESSQRRSAIQHLRAAVAATRAEKKAGAELQKDVDDTPYRSDLANVVRPRRPSAAGEGARSERPVESRPAPLKLVAEQRIDTAREPIRPRRVSATDLSVSDTSGSESGSDFSAFAQSMGASQLPDLLEAAAAYMSDVEGRPQFSRPMLMHKLQEVEKENFSREDGLRSFGQLLRQGKLQKLKGGRFAVTDETEFRGQTRNVG